MDYLPAELSHEKLSHILNSIGLEVESYEKYEEVPGHLEGLLIGKVVACTPHPNADRLRLTKVDIGQSTHLDIVCGAPNVAEGQTVLVAPVGATIYPKGHPPMTMKTATIRGVQSQGMICAEDEAGLGDSHEGILVLPGHLAAGMPAAAYFEPYSDYVISIGLTPNRSDAMSHLGVARDVCAWLNHHEKRNVSVRHPLDHVTPPTSDTNAFPVSILATGECGRYAGVCISGVEVKESPKWLQQRLQAIGIRSINNIVDATNYVLHETGQPLHAFDAEKIAGRSIQVRQAAAGTVFMSLDGKERGLDAQDLMICDGNGDPMCMAGIFGGLHSGVTDSTKEIFLESAWFHPIGIRKSSFRHGLRTEAAVHFEKGVDISRTADVLLHAADLICKISGGSISSAITDVYPNPAKPRELSFSFSYIHRLSGKAYTAEDMRGILSALGFQIVRETAESMTVRIPIHKTDISLPADIAEEIMRMDGFDNIEIPRQTRYSPTMDSLQFQESLREKMASALAGSGYQEVLNNSITSSSYYTEEELQTAVRMMNSLSAELDIMRPGMLEPGLQTVAHNLNRRNLDLQLFEFGKTYASKDPGGYEEKEHLALYLTGMVKAASWNQAGRACDLYYLKGKMDALFACMGIRLPVWEEKNDTRMDILLQGRVDGSLVAKIGRVSEAKAGQFGIRQEVWFADIHWGSCLELAKQVHIRYREVPRFPSVSRDLSILVDQGLPYEKVRITTEGLKIPALKGYGLFDIFESEKLGIGKKSMTLTFQFRDDESTLTDNEVDGMMKKIMKAYEKELHAELRK